MHHAKTWTNVLLLQKMKGKHSRLLNVHLPTGRRLIDKGDLRNDYQSARLRGGCQSSVHLAWVNRGWEESCMGQLCVIQPVSHKYGGHDRVRHDMLREMRILWVSWLRVEQPNRHTHTPGNISILLHGDNKESRGTRGGRSPNHPADGERREVGGAEGINFKFAVMKNQ